MLMTNFKISKLEIRCQNGNKFSNINYKVNTTETVLKQPRTFKFKKVIHIHSYNQQVLM